MGNVVENRAVVDVVPLSGPAAGPAESWRVYRVRVDTAYDVAGYPNLLTADLPRELEALVPTALADRLGMSGPWRVTASLVGPGRMRVEAPA
jgi:hypothetical protein